MLPEIIQGGMGVAVSGWRLASTVSQAGQLGVVSGTALDSVLARRLQDGDPGGELRRAIAAFPYSEVAEEALDRFFLPEGRAPNRPYRMLPMFRNGAPGFAEQFLALANFVEVYLAKEGHTGLVGINHLTKIQAPTLPSLYGAMLAGVDYVLMGAGIPMEVPGILDRLSEGKDVSMRLDVSGDDRDNPTMLHFDPASLGATGGLKTSRPRFLPIISATSLATAMTRRATGSIEGFIIEGWTAGGHNAPPRGKASFNDRGEPTYGPRDAVDLKAIAELGLPFWLAGGQGTPQGLREAQEAGAAGIQVGTLFAFCDESGLRQDLREQTISLANDGTADVYTDPKASPTGFPFKVVRLEDSLSEEDTYAERHRVCDLGYLRVAVRDSDGRLAFRCPAEPQDQYVAKAGDAEDSEGRKCLCNALMANIGLAQVRKDGTTEAPLLTSGDDLLTLGDFLKGRDRYGALDVLEYLLQPVTV